LELERQKASITFVFTSDAIQTNATAAMDTEKKLPITERRASVKFSPYILVLNADHAKSK